MRFARTAAALLAAAAAGAAAEPAAPRWDEAFPVTAAPERVHFQARWRDAQGAWHTLQVWRDADRTLHRRTDDRIDLYGRRRGGEWQFRLLDLRRRIAADVSRTNLHRIGVFADVFGLAHVLDPPRQAWGVEDAPAPPGLAAGGDCRWRALLRPQAAPARTLVCWSAAWGLPRVIAEADGDTVTAVFHLDAVDTEVDASPGLPPVPAGFAQVDVDADIDPAAD